MKTGHGELPLRCGDADALVGYLYDECSPEERARVALHLQSCAACSDEVAGLRGARQELSEWTPPEVALGFRIAASPTVVPMPVRVAWWRRPMPAWGQAVAATVIFGLGMAAGSRGQGTSVAGGAPRVASPAASAAELTKLEERLGQEIARVRAAVPASASPAAVVRASDSGRDAELLRQVRQLIRESEDRQQESFTMRAAQLARDAEIQRRVELAQLQQTLAQVQGTTGEEVRRQREMLNYLVNVSQRR